MTHKNINDMDIVSLRRDLMAAYAQLQNRAETITELQEQVKHAGITIQRLASENERYTQEISRIESSGALWRDAADIMQYLLTNQPEFSLAESLPQRIMKMVERYRLRIYELEERNERLSTAALNDAEKM